MGTPLPSPKRGRSPQIFGPCLLWPNGCMDQDGTLHGGRPQPRRLCVRWGPSRPPQSPIFGPCLLWPNGWIDQDGTWHGGRPLSRPHCADGEPAPLPQKGGRTPQFSAHFYCRQTAGCIKMPLGMEVGLGPGDFVFDGDPATPRTEGTPTTTLFLAHV